MQEDNDEHTSSSSTTNDTSSTTTTQHATTTNNTHSPYLTASPEIQSPTPDQNNSTNDDEFEDVEEEPEADDPEEWGAKAFMAHLQARLRARRGFGGGNNGPMSRLTGGGSQNEPKDGLHPYVAVLTIQDVDGASVLEESRSGGGLSKDEIRKNLETSSELSLGIFSTLPGSETKPKSKDNKDKKSKTDSNSDSQEPSSPSTSTGNASLLATSHVPDSFNPSHKTTLLGMILSTIDLTTSKSSHRTVHIQTMCIAPEFRHKTLGTTLLKAYIQRIAGAGICDRITVGTDEAGVKFLVQAGFSESEEEVEGKKEGEKLMVFECGSVSDLY